MGLKTIDASILPPSVPPTCSTAIGTEWVRPISSSVVLLLATPHPGAQSNLL